MEQLIVEGGYPLTGTIVLSGAKNVALKAFVAALLTDDEIILHNIPDIRDVHFMLDVIMSLGYESTYQSHTVQLKRAKEVSVQVPLEVGARLRTSSMVLGPMLARHHEAIIPNPGGCRIGARPIDRHIDGLRSMGATVDYSSDDGYFHATCSELHGADYTFPKNTHTGTETLLLAAVLAKGTTVLKNAAEEIEVDDLIHLLVTMGANIRRTAPKEITIQGVKRLHGTEYSIMSDRNEEVTYAIAAAMSGGSIQIENSEHEHLQAFNEAFLHAGGIIKPLGNGTTEYTHNGQILPTDIITLPHPGFMTDWQAPWAVFMTQAGGVSTIHETVFESRFSYVTELRKMGASIDYFDPIVENPEVFYNFNWADRVEGYHNAIKIQGPTKLHNAIMTMSDLRAGATIVLAALVAHGKSIIYGIEQIDRGYEKIEQKLLSIGAHITREKEEAI